MSKVHHFKDSLNKGKDGEAKLLSLWDDLVLLDGFTHDFCLQSTGQHLELKTDSYDMAKTPNFFIEVWSDLERKKMGGPQQARKNGTELFGYFYTKNNTLFLFETAKIAAYVDDNWMKYDPINIFNTKWITVGIKVPRVALEPILLRKETFK